jgi:hypothetical protein
MHDELGEVAETKRQRFNLLSNIWHHDLANRLKMRRKSDARTMGLGDDYPVGTYPSHPATIVQSSSPLPAILAALGLAGGGLMGGIGLMSLLGGTGDRPPAVQPTLSPRRPLSPLQFDIEILGTEDGIKANVIPPED